MVTFKLIEETEQFLVYWYYPNGHEETHGIIVVDRESGQIKLRIPDPNNSGSMYASHAMRKIVKAWTEGVTLKDGSAIWY